MSYQAEERYWTDYVRVATPIIGLLLLLGVFWYWASSLIGSDTDDPPPTEIAANVTVIAAPTFTPTATQEVTLPVETPAPSPTGEVVEPTPDDGEPTEEPTEDTGEVPTEEASDDSADDSTDGGSVGRFAAGDPAIVLDDDVNLRSEPSTDADVVEVLTENAGLTVLDGTAQESGGIEWWNVRVNDSENEGWVSNEWISPPE